MQDSCSGVQDNISCGYQTIGWVTLSGLPEGERQCAGHAQGKVLYVCNYRNPSFGPFVEVCCSIIGGFKLLMHVFIHFHAFSLIFLLISTTSTPF